MRSWALVLGMMCGAGAAASAAEFRFAPVGIAFSSALLPNDPLVGQEVVSTRIVLDVRVDPGFDAADFLTELLLPIDPFPGRTNFLLLEGSELGWSGSGLFHFEEVTDRFNGVFVARRYGGSTPGENFSGEILESSVIRIEHVPSPGALLVALGGALVAARRRR